LRLLLAHSNLQLQEASSEGSLDLPGLLLPLMLAVTISCRWVLNLNNTRPVMFHLSKNVLRHLLIFPRVVQYHTMHNVLFMAKTEFLKVIRNIVYATFKCIISHKSIIRTFHHLQY
jgi:hypothetical protein